MIHKIKKDFIIFVRLHKKNDMLVVLEGLDGAGKSTQVKRLRNYLESLYGSL